MARPRTVHLQFSGGVDSGVVGINESIQAQRIGSHCPGLFDDQKIWRVVAAKLFLEVDPTLIQIFRADLEGSGNGAEPADASPLFGLFFSPPDTFSSLMFIWAAGFPNAFQWLPGAPVPPPGRARFTEYLPLAVRDPRWIDERSMLHFLGREFGPGASEGWIANFTLWLQPDEKGWPS